MSKNKIQVIFVFGEKDWMDRYGAYRLSKFDPEKFKPSKVIIATDADADGKHIQGLLLIMFLKYLPFVVEQG